MNVLKPDDVIINNCLLSFEIKNDTPIVIFNIDLGNMKTNLCKKNIFFCKKLM